jgi:hypothetical protein
VARHKGRFNILVSSLQQEGKIIILDARDEVDNGRTLNRK